jgi:DNA helicase-2/ATP-dependent DNA helicase PcrA
MTRLAALRARLGGGKQLPVDITSPYFAHIRLRESGKSKDVLVGKRGFIDRQSNVQIVDWRNAPVSRIYYRYEEGDDYEEEIAGRRVEGLVEVRRNVSIARSNLRRIGAPETFHIAGEGQAVGEITPVLRNGQQRPPGGRARRQGQPGIHHGARAPIKALPGSPR